MVEKQIGVDISNEKLVKLANVNIQTSFPLTGFEANVVYRFRFLNNKFEDTPGTVMRISFSYNNCSDNITEREYFSISGAYSSLFHQSIDNQQSFVINQAERMEILIKFRAGEEQFAICADDKINEIPV